MRGLSDGDAVARWRCRWRRVAVDALCLVRCDPTRELEERACAKFASHNTKKNSWQSRRRRAHSHSRTSTPATHAATSHPYKDDPVRPSRTFSFGDQLGLVRGTKSKVEDGYATGTSLRRGVAVGDLAGAQRLRLQLVHELSPFLLLSAALSQPLPSAHRRWVSALR